VPLIKRYRDGQLEEDESAGTQNVWNRGEVNKGLLWEALRTQATWNNKGYLRDIS
jgi:hypothetical protein